MADALGKDSIEFETRSRLLAMSARAFSMCGPKQQHFAEAAEEQIKLEREQRQLSHNLVGHSLRRTIFDAVQRREYELAEGLATKFKLRPRCYLLTKVRALVAAHAWQDLEQMSNERQVQRELGLFEFFKACFEQGNLQAATQFAIRIREAELRLDAFIALSIWDEAADIVLQLRDEDKRVSYMNTIAQRCKDPEIRPIILQKFNEAPQRSRKGNFLSRLF